jgi:UDP-2,3-diacylglucosamine pyrophosphatase LpxH
MSTEHANLLIISDLHLGEDIRPGAFGSLRHMVKLERELSSFLTHYTNQRLGDRPWRLIINGDMVDFLGVCLLPGESDFAVLTPEEHVWGLGTHPRAARAKMERVLERHAGVFRALATFVAAGNEVDIVVGNHDVEFHWPIVQETFKRGVARLAPEAASRSLDEVATAIRFHPWFYFEENVAWVEHGHQYDGYCSFDYVLQPAVEPVPVAEQPAAIVDENSQEIQLNVASAGLRYVTNHTGGYKEGQESWTFFGYLFWGISLGMMGLWRLATGFYLMSARLIGLWRRYRAPEARERRRAVHRARLKDLADQFRLSEETLLAVDELRRTPLVHNLGKLLAALMLDKLLVFGTAAVLVMGFALALPWSWAIGAVAFTVITATITSRVLARGREDLDPSDNMRQVTQQIRQRVHAPYVVFGHTHAPRAVPLSDGGMYFNTGTWVQHGDPAPGSEHEHAFTHVMIRHEDTGPVAALCEWKDGESRKIH